MKLNEIITGNRVADGQCVKLAGADVRTPSGEIGAMSKSKRGVLELCDVYTEKYLLAFTVNEGETTRC